MDYIKELKEIERICKTPNEFKTLKSGTVDKLMLILDHFNKKKSSYSFSVFYKIFLHSVRVESEEFEFSFMHKSGVLKYCERFIRIIEGNYYFDENDNSNYTELDSKKITINNNGSSHENKSIGEYSLDDERIRNDIR